MSAEIVRYGNTALAAGAMHQDITEKTMRPHLRQIYECLPKGESAIVQFFISTDDATSPGTRVHHAATALFENITGRSVNVQVTIASYESGRYRTPEIAIEDANPLALENGSIDQGSALAISSGSSASTSNEVEVTRHLFISNEGAQELAKLDKQNYQPHFVIASAIQSIFPNGIPLPTHQHFHYCTFSVKHSSGPYFTLHRHVRGLSEAIGTRHTPSGHLVQGNDWNGEKYEKLKEVAKGLALPDQLDRESNPRVLGSCTVKTTPALLSSNSESHPQIEKINE